MDFRAANRESELPQDHVGPKEAYLTTEFDLLEAGEVIGEWVLSQMLSLKNLSMRFQLKVFSL